jgi:hypothetical protein
MNRDLEALIKAFITMHECRLSERPHYLAEYETLPENALRGSTGVSREKVTELIRRRAAAFVKAQSRPPSLPPRA